MRAYIMFRRALLAIITTLLVVVLVGGTGYAGYRFYNETFIHIDFVRYRRDITELDMSGKKVKQTERIAELTQLEMLDLRDTGLTAEQYEMLHSALPECDIRWTPCFQGQYYPQDTKAITVSSLSDEDVAYLDYFPELATVNAQDCRDYDQIMALIERRSECQVLYEVGIGQREYLQDSTFIRIPDADPVETQELLRYLPNLKSILFTGKLPSLEEIDQLAESYPDVTMEYQVDFHGVIVRPGDTEMDISGIALESVEEIESMLPYMPTLTKVTMFDCGIPTEDMITLSERHKDIQFFWTANIGGVDIRTDVTEFNISGTYIGDASIIERLLPYFPNLTKAIMSGCGIDNESMDALRQRYQNIKFVWSVSLGGKITVRTDITTFMPVMLGHWMETEDLYNLRYCTDLIAVDIGHHEVSNCDWAAYMPNLKYLILADTPISSLEPLRGLKNLVYLEIFLTQVTDYSPLLTCTALEDLNLSWTFGDPEPIAQMTWLKRLWWGGKQHSYYYRQLFRQNMPDAEIQLDDGDSTGSGWRKGKRYYEQRDLFGMFYME